MKAHIKTLFAATAILFASCQEEALFNNTTVPKAEFTAETESNDPSTRTALSNNNVLWKQGDQVSIFAASTINEQYQVTDASDGQTSATLQAVSPSGGFNAGTELPANIAYYPYSSTNAIAKDGTSYSLTVSLPATQTYAVGSFGNGSFPMTAVTSSTADHNLKFKNVLGGIMLQLKGTASIASISITGGGEEILYGTATVTASDTETPAINMTGNGKTVTLDCGTGVQLNAETATSFVIALPPMTMTSGFTVVVTDTDGKEMEIKTTKSQTITRSNLLKMPAVNYEGTEKTSDLPVGALSGVFSIGNGKKVHFSKGNLRETYDSETHSYYWGFAEKQYEIGGDGNIKNLFGWSGDSHSNYGSSTETASGYYDGYFLEWGTQVDDEGTWRTLSADEWNYLLGTNSERNGKYKNWVSVNGINGLVIAPDDFQGTIADSYSATTWAEAENEGLVFLPASGYRYGYDNPSNTSMGHYWTSTSTSQYSQYASEVWFSSDGFGVSKDGTRRFGYCVRLVSDITNPTSVDLGLSVKWATYNVGARTPFGRGKYFGWGETKGYGEEDNSNTRNYEKDHTYVKTIYSQEQYKYGTGTYPKVSVTKYCADDSKYVLDANDDMATASWGEDWRTPTKEEMEELINTSNCMWTWYDAFNTEFNGVPGYKVQSMIPGYTDNYIFLPTTSWRYESSFYTYSSIRTCGSYWSSSLYMDNERCASTLEFDGSSENHNIDYNERWWGLCVRPVTDK